MNDFNIVFNKFPDNIKYHLERLPECLLKTMEEIRIQLGQPVRVISSNREIVIHPNNNETITREDMDSILTNLLNNSVYAYEEELAKGYVTIEGGHRVGICGRAVNKNGAMTFIKDISSLNIRRCREIKGIGESVIEKLYSRECGLQNTIIISPPKCGKTTLLRDIIRILSNSGLRISVCDERSELAGMHQGIRTYDLGPRTDVLDGCAKAEGMIMMIRSMSPDVLVTDEIGKAEDIESIQMAVSAGVRVLTTVHGKDYEDLIKSPAGTLVNKGLFSRIVVLTNIPTTGTIKEVINV